MKIPSEIFPRLVESVKLIASFRQHPKRIDVERTKTFETDRKDRQDTIQKQLQKRGGKWEMGCKVSFRFHVSNFKTLICNQMWHQDPNRQWCATCEWLLAKRRVWGSHYRRVANCQKRGGNFVWRVTNLQVKFRFFSPFFMSLFKTHTKGNLTWPMFVLRNASCESNFMQISRPKRQQTLKSEVTWATIVK